MFHVAKTGIFEGPEKSNGSEGKGESGNIP